MSSFDKLKLLIWKNFLLQRRHKWQTIFEIASPVIFSLFLILTRCLVNPEEKPAKHYPPFLPTYFNISGRNLGNLTTTRTGTLAFSPENPLTRKVTKDAITLVAEDNFSILLSFLFDSNVLPQPKGFKNAKEMETALTKPDAMSQILVGIQFEDSMANATAWPNDVKVTLRFPAVMRTPMVEHPLRASWRTNLLYPLFPKPGPRNPDDMYGGFTPGYTPEMFLAVQHAVSQEIIKQKSGKPIGTKVYLQRLPQLAYRDDLLLVALERFISMIIMLCFAYTFVNTVRVVTFEKELQLKETMTIMGLPSWLHWLAWFIKQFSFLMISVVLIVILFKIPFNKTTAGHGYSVLTFTPWSVLFFFLALFIIASLAFSFMVSVFFSRANTAASFMGLAWFAAYSIYMVTQVLYEDISLTTKLLLSLISNTAMGYAFQMLVMCEGTSQGLQWNEFFTPISYQDKLQPGHIVLMLILDTILYMLIAMYVEKIRPGLYGVPLPWYFPFTKSFWLPNKRKVAEINRKDMRDLEYNDALLKVVHDHEEEPKGVPVGVNIQNLTKIYKGRKKVVDNLNLRMYENEITVLLGHNGAGKTTTISMLTGIVPPTSGKAYINGYNIVSETGLARKSLGICPQHNVLFPDLTVAEHIIFYSRLKGVPNSKLEEEVNHFVKLLNLEEKRNVTSNKLSGGQKRRLSVGAAMCGNSSVVLLDEPTSGLDPAARRALWDLLLKEKKGRTMILTTHFMDEADILGDRIAIMSGGRLQCVGTPYFLKKHYGIGYKMTIVKGENCIADDVTKFFRNYVPDIKENTNIGSELTYILPSDNVSKFPKMLKEFEAKREALSVTSYGLSVTSLEEVFMKAGAEDVDSSSAEGNNATGPYNDCAIAPLANPHNAADNEPIQKVRGFKLLRNHIKAMFLKLAYNSMRNKLTAAIQFVTPIINISISVVIARSWKFLSELPPLTLSLESGFVATQTLLSQDNVTDGSIEAKAMTAYKNYFKTSKYPGMRLTDIGTADLGKFYLKLSATEHGRVRNEIPIGATFGARNITAWFGNYGYHDSAISLAHVNNALMSALSPGSSLKIVNHPLPYSIEHLVKVMATGSSMGFQFAFNIGFCMAFVTAFLVLFVIKERTSGAKLLQRVSGVRPAVMWLTAFVWDWMWLFLVYLCIIITLACFQENTLSTPAELGRVLLVLMVFSVATIPLHYLASFYFEAAATGFSKMCFMNIFTGCMPFLITELLRLPEVGSPFYAHLFDWVFSPLPIYCISRSFRDMSVSTFQLMACEGLCTQLKITNCTRYTICKQMRLNVCCIDENPYLQWSEPGIGRYLFMMGMVGLISFTLLLIKEYELVNKVFYRSKNQPAASVVEEDSDVAAERHHVQALTRAEISQQSLVCRDLTKYFDTFLAVNKLSFAVHKGECFGLLGINGAGKTTTFRMLTGDVHISAGDAFVHGLSIKTHLQDVYRHIGYCPQFDALLDNLTGRETLRILCLLRGIPAATGAARALSLATTLGFLRHYDKKVHECSGGTKRKISTAVSLLGDSSLVFLDEPTTGMDPASKRLVWACISEAVVAGRSVVLTSHSMEECEALCSRLTVMVNGRMYCLGPLQHLKNKFSQGYSLIVKCKSGPTRDNDVIKIHNYVAENFSDSRLIESHLGISTYYINDLELPWWRLFHAMEEAREQFPIEDYSVTQTTLEQVFMQFTKLQGNAEV
ncbi:hypothetical protein PYW08_016515 [Mythimna loreyi]|uniref:Uncharacterized protein n=1 Tax=Mythimna loreyi TaxID=667449 RepID=A0ACC2QZX6_9NEOP|nr:hypothetical protein PYW08_016515 [Mythimna loreyi]